jgi:hypothetical protein
VAVGDETALAEHEAHLARRFVLLQQWKPSPSESSSSLWFSTES